MASFKEKTEVRIEAFINWMKKVTVPGFRGQSLFYVSRYFIRSMFDDDLILRASSLAFNFFLAIFPATIFLFTAIAYIPLENLHEDILAYFENLLPHNAYQTLSSTIADILKIQRGDLLSFGFAAAIFFSSNGFLSMLSSFQKYTPKEKRRTWYMLRLRSIFVTILVSSMLILSILVITYITITMGWLNDRNILKGWLYSFGLQSLEYVSVFSLFYFIISSLYFFGSQKGRRWSFFTPGGTVATLLSVLTTFGFAYYVNSFNSYNKLYGSIGTLIALMILIYFHCIVVLIGFELNSSIDLAEERASQKKNIAR